MDWMVDGTCLVRFFSEKCGCYYIYSVHNKNNFMLRSRPYFMLRLSSSYTMCSYSGAPPSLTMRLKRTYAHFR